MIAGISGSRENAIRWVEFLAVPSRQQQTGIIGLLLERGARSNDIDGRGKQVRQAAASEWNQTLLNGKSG